MNSRVLFDMRHHVTHERYSTGCRLFLIFNFRWVVSIASMSPKGCLYPIHDDVIKWNHFPRDCPFVRGIHWSPVNSPHNGQSRGALMFSLICAWIIGWVNNREARETPSRPLWRHSIGKKCSNTLTPEQNGCHFACDIFPIPILTTNVFGSNVADICSN